MTLRLTEYLAERVLDEWLKEEQQYYKVEFHGFNNGYDTETNAWVTWQLPAKNEKVRPGREK